MILMNDNDAIRQIPCPLQGVHVEIENAHDGIRITATWKVQGSAMLSAKAIEAITVGSRQSDLYDELARTAQHAVRALVADARAKLEEAKVQGL